MRFRARYSHPIGFVCLISGAGFLQMAQGEENKGVERDGPWLFASELAYEGILKKIEITQYKWKPPPVVYRLTIEVIRPRLLETSVQLREETLPIKVQAGNSFQVDFLTPEFVVRDGKKASLADLQVGDRVRWYETRSAAPNAHHTLIAESPEFVKKAEAQKDGKGAQNPAKPPDAQPPQKQALDVEK